LQADFEVNLMTTTSQRILVFLICAGLSASAAAQSFMGLGELPGGDFNSAVRHLSADGRFVTGTDGQESFIWSEGTGMISLEGASGGGLAVSNDGTIGVNISAATYLWTSRGGLTAFDPYPAETVNRAIINMSSDGGSIVGTYRINLGDFTAYRWSSSEGLVDVATGVANDVSANGTVVVGRMNVNPNMPVFIEEAFRWTSDGGAVGLGYLPGTGTNSSNAEAVSADGIVVVGHSGDLDSPFEEAFRWTESGGMVGLGDLSAVVVRSHALDTTADGNIVVGVGTTSSGFDPFIWDETHGMRNLVDVLTNDFGLGLALAGWDLYDAAAISDDGLVIVGTGINPDGNVEAWRAVLVPEPSTVLLGGLACMGLLLSRRHCDRLPHFLGRGNL
jgi:probable HAF family extracellular repeat protein